MSANPQRPRVGRGAGWRLPLVVFARARGAAVRAAVRRRRLAPPFRADRPERAAADLPGLDGAPGLADADLRQGHVSVVNVFASWCEPCHVEHPILMALADDDDAEAKGVDIYGVAQKDSPDNVRRFLGAMGDPYAKVGLDRDGRAGIDWGVYGVPETFIVRGDGTIAYKVVGPMTAETLESEVKPEILKAMAPPRS